MNEWAAAQIAARMSEIEELVINFKNNEEKDSLFIRFDLILEDFSFDVENDAPEFGYNPRMLLNAYEHAYADACVELAKKYNLECSGWSAGGVSIRKV